MSKIAVVLAGGQGSRLRDVWKYPKVLVPIGPDKVFLDWLVEYLHDQKFEEIILLLGYRSADVINYLSDLETSLKISFRVEAEPLGTGGAIVELVRDIDSISPELWLFNGDTIYTNNLPKTFLDHTWAPGKFLLLTKCMVENRRYGSVSISNDSVDFSRGENSSFIPNSQVYIGAARIQTSLLKGVKLDNPFSLEDMLTQISIEEGVENFEFITVDFDFLDFGVPDDFKKISRS